MKKCEEPGTQALSRAVSVLNSFSEGRYELSLTEVSDMLSLPKPTVHRLLSAMKYHGFIEQDGGGQKYRLGWKLFELGTRVNRIHAIQEKAHPYLQGLSERSKETVHLAILKEGNIFYIDKIQGLYAMSMVTSVGLKLPAYLGGLGKCLLAFLPENELLRALNGRKLKKFTSNTLTEPIRLQEALREVRGKGYAIDHEEFEIGLTCVGVPIWDFSNKVVAAISIAGPTFRMNKERMPHYIKLAVETGRKISQELGYRSDSRSQGSEL